MRRLLLLLVAVIVCARSASADSLPCVAGSIKDYVSLGSVGCTVEDKVFSNFSAFAAVFGMGLRITPIDEAFNPGFGFTVSNGFEDVGIDMTISYDVRVLPGGNLIKDNSLKLDPSTNAFKIGITETKTFRDGSTLVIGVSDLFTSDGAVFSPVDALHVDTHVTAVKRDPAEPIFVNFREQFSEVNPVPEPTSLLLLGTGLMGLGGVVRRRKTSKGKQE